jgi:hypothetical protein|tara:strand:- start:511 stop:750 length:240 start_codon:yes stop_codon:yes gene_type:complete
MRNSETDLIGEQLQSAFTKSGLSVQEFITHIAVTRADTIIDQRDNAFDILVGRKQLPSLKGAESAILTCYFNAGWWCKA